ncbi:MAG: alpha/beta hydrolase [Ignavibacteriales bacterium]|nr:alpha/beta hydrolase [Ignavibacteriales bacterium]
MKNSLNILIVLAALGLPCMGQDTPERYRDRVFDSHQLESDIQYGTLPVHLLDLYSPPASDVERVRPLVIYIHGGGFKNQSKVGVYQTRVCTTLARMGYVVVSIGYRLTDPIPDTVSYFEAMMRGLQDAKAAVRFFRKNAAVYGVDPNRVYATGSSAGSIIALHMAYLDSAKVPRWIRWGNVGGSFEGTSGTSGYSSTIQAVISCWGAIGDTSWMSGSNIPVYSVHGLDDTTVFYERIPSYKVFKFGSKHITEAAMRLGIVCGDRIFSNTGHTLDNNGARQDSAIQDFSRWLYLTQKSGSGRQGARK